MLISRSLSRLRIETRRPFALRGLASSAPRNDTLAFNGNIYSLRWLRDSCQCPQCVHPSTRQKLHRTSDIPETVKPVDGSVGYAADGIHISWGPEHQSFYPSTFLQRYSSPPELHRFHRDINPSPWLKEDIHSASDLFLKYEDINTERGLLQGLTQLTRYGLLFVTGVPIKETSNSTCEARTLARKFSEIRETFYGELWDVINVRNSTNIAYTNLHLGLHMDLLYFEHPPRYQQLHCLRNRVQGGTSLFVDALKAANRLRESYPEAFEILTKVPVPFHYINDGNHLHYSHPTLELDDQPSIDGSPRRVKYINYSPPFQAPLPSDTPESFYTALQKFAELLEGPEATFEYLLREGDAVLFDNRRVLHARTAFVDLAQENGESTDKTNRWLKGCYMEADEVLNRRRVLEEKLSRP